MRRVFIPALVLSVGLGAEWTNAGNRDCALENGDANGDGTFDISDVVYTLGFQFLGGPAPVPFCVPVGATREGCAAKNGDTNGDGAIDISDAVYSLNFKFLGGPAPVAICAGGMETLCDNEVDDDNDGAADCADIDCTTLQICLMADGDKDGFTIAEGDCNDTNASVNPGAFDFGGNEIDDDCDGTSDPARSICDNGLESDSSDPMTYALAMDLCQTSPSSSARTWGVISADLSLLNGADAPNPMAHSVRAEFGTGNLPRFGGSMAVLSTGHAAARGQTNPPHAPFQVGQDLGLMSHLPGDWLAANGGVPPNAPGCPPPSSVTVGNDPVMLALRIRVPTNARSFRLSAKFFSAEYPEFVCSAHNDFFVVLLDSSFSGAPANPTDKNLAVVDTGAGVFVPVGVNLASGNTGLFQDCQNGPTGCADGQPGSHTACTGTTGLVGTGMDVVNPPSPPDVPSGCGPSNLAGGATAWLTIQGNMEPGEVIDLRIAVWDTSDGLYDSVVLLDNFEWSAAPIQPGATAAHSAGRVRQ